MTLRRREFETKIDVKHDDLGRPLLLLHLHLGTEVAVKRDSSE